MPSTHPLRAACALRLTAPSTACRAALAGWRQSPQHAQFVDFAITTTTTPTLSHACWLCGLSNDSPSQVPFSVEFVDFGGCSNAENGVSCELCGLWPHANSENDPLLRNLWTLKYAPLLCTRKCISVEFVDFGLLKRAHAARLCDYVQHYSHIHSLPGTNNPRSDSFALDVRIML
jgi:hypothetical protein